MIDIYQKQWFSPCWYEISPVWRCTAGLLDILILNGIAAPPPGKKSRTSEICAEMIKEMPINLISPDLWARQPVDGFDCHAGVCLWRLGMLINWRSDWWSLRGSGAEHYRHCYQRMEETSPCPFRVIGRHFELFYIGLLDNTCLR